MDDQKRTGVAIALIFLVMVGWMWLYQYLYPPHPPHPPQPAKTATAGESQPAGSSPTAVGGKEVPSQAAAAPAAGKASARATPEQPPRQISVDTPLYRAVFSTQGADLVAWELKKHRDESGKKPFEMVRGIFGRAGPLSTRLQVGAEELSDTARVFAYTGPEAVEIPQDGQKTLEFTWVDGKGFEWIKRVTLTGDNYGVGLTNTVRDSSKEPRPATLSLLAALNPAAAAGEVSSGAGPEIILSALGKLHRKTPQDLLEDDEELAGESFDGWEGVGVQYFLYAWAPDNAPLSKALLRKGEDAAEVAVRLTFPERRIGGEGAEPFEQEASIFIGPKDRDRVAAFGHGLIAAIDFGFFAKIARGLLWVLLQLEPLVNDYGWAIVLLTLLVRIVLFPLSVWQFKSMRAMQHIAPLLKEVREKYKSDAQRQQQEMMNLYRRHKVNPFGGCLPMLAQIPVFLALYTALLNAIELRHAAWGGTWIHDLSHKDPYYVMPVLMTATTYLSMRLSPSPSADPMQQKMMQIMPLFFLFIFISMPAGLVVYWTVSNILSIGQQLYINRAAKAAEGVAHPSMLPDVEALPTANARSARKKGRSKK